MKTVGRLQAEVTLLCGFFFQAEDGIRDLYVTGVQTCALPIWLHGDCLFELRLRNRTGRQAVGKLGPRHRGIRQPQWRVGQPELAHGHWPLAPARSEERRVGKECRSRRAPEPEKKNKQMQESER